MKKMIAFLAVAMFSSTVFAEALKVSCRSSSGDLIEILGTVGYTSEGFKIAAFEENEFPEQAIDYSKRPIRTGRDEYTLTFNYNGNDWVTFSVSACDDQFSAQGAGEQKKYSNGRVSKFRLSCDCEVAPDLRSFPR